MQDEVSPVSIPKIILVQDDEESIPMSAHKMFMVDGEAIAENTHKMLEQSECFGAKMILHSLSRSLVLSGLETVSEFIE